MGETQEHLRESIGGSWDTIWNSKESHREIKGKSPKVFHGFSSGFPMVFLWFPYGFPLVFLWFSYGFPVVFRWFSYCFPLVSNDCPIMLLILFLWFLVIFVMVFQYFSCHFPTILFWGRKPKESHRNTSRKPWEHLATKNNGKTSGNKNRMSIIGTS